MQGKQAQPASREFQVSRKRQTVDGQLPWFTHLSTSLLDTCPVQGRAPEASDEHLCGQEASPEEEPDGWSHNSLAPPVLGTAEKHRELWVKQGGRAPPEEATVGPGVLVFAVRAAGIPEPTSPTPFGTRALCDTEDKQWDRVLGRVAVFELSW